ncbi:ATP-dependent Clp protease ATP-binding subunit ClpX [Alkalilimnicola ehrlichii MLHE-1]|uniref:ATP-dependent Clp protease, ATP-binding subunit ClpX n=1 Tax=Alkalilimnicola ehrlichii (strain ATCC BAA-1101 / DSM 17681 / MLHE-1) TaxID=187272 RepID=Q0AC08_ALKEH|nr:ATP-dependent Clp protease ATP-binding subunit ClpX [Alkalilimnicola ehrlichii]ABI55629.1 ATP-dependent Clp protease, ATP-binding subunit ClpX [Alkalilimnicola ehrlichii MLHE-1]
MVEHEPQHQARGEHRQDHAHCSFCGRPEDQTGPLIAGAEAWICEDCVAESKARLDSEFTGSLTDQLAGLSTPRQLHAHLDGYVIGQERAKRQLAVAVYNHYKRLIWRGARRPGEVAKSNILMVGPTGSGKTLLLESLARHLEVPFVTADASTFTAAGYAGADVDDIAVRLLEAAGGDPAAARRGMVFLDEVDKLACRAPGGSGNGRDFSGEGVQQALLRLLEGRVVNVPRRGRGGGVHSVDTRDVLFVCGGAFQGLRQQMAGRRAGGGVGFGARLAETAEPPAVPDADDLVHYGLIPELVGRLPVVTTLEALSEAQLLEVISRPRNALLRQYQALFRQDGCELHFTAGALEALARRAAERGTGARGLRAELERLLLEPMYHVPARGDVEAVVVTTESVAGAPVRYCRSQALRQVG